MKLIIVDLDGTLFDTKDVNYHAYKEALEEYGYSIDYDYYCHYCNGRHYKEFLPQITTQDETILQAIHTLKKKAYKKYISLAKPNGHLVRILSLLRGEYRIALVTTASKVNCDDIMDEFKLRNLFDLILTQEDISTAKPDPEGFIKAMEMLNAGADETIIFEDSDVGLEAARRSGASYYKTFGYN